MSRCIGLALGVFLSLGFSASSLGMDIKSNKYSVYYGDVDGDGDANDIYFHGKSQIILIHGEIITPIVIPAPRSYALLSEGRAYSVVEYDPALEDSELSALSLASENSDYYLADFDKDGHQDILLRGASASDTAVIVSGKAASIPPTVLVAYTGTNSLATNLSVRSNKIALRDVDSDGRVDITIVSGDPDTADVVYLNTSNAGFPYVASYDQGSQTRPATIVGSSAGEFRVSESGASTYSVPITLPQGVAGVLPSVALSYSSMGGNSHMGLGWSIQAGSAITRCRQTLYQDGAALPITLGQDDRFCLDGQRLILQSGVYGAAGSSYKTEIDNYSIITAEGGSQSTPTYFKVISKDGSLRRYGFTATSRQKLGGKTFTWAISDSVDNTQRASNRIYYDYQGGANNFRLNQIRYANNAALVKFNYANRPDIQSQYIAGYRLTTTERLTSVEVKDNDVLLRTYFVSYLGVTPVNNFSRVGAIQECVGGGTQCLPALDFEWAEQDLSIDNIADDSLVFISAEQSKTICPRNQDSECFITTPASSRVLTDYKPADFNGDGCSDVVYGYFDRHVNKFFVEYSLANESCTALEAAKFSGGGLGDALQFDLAEESNTVNLNILDYNSDGRSDLAIRVSEDGEWAIHLSRPSMDGAWRIDSRSAVTLDEADHFIDINSDGLVDALVANDRALSIRYLERSVGPLSYPDRPNSYSSQTQELSGLIYSTFEPGTFSCGFGEEDGYISPIKLLKGNFTGDFNGDGKIDVLVRTSETRYCRGGLPIPGSGGGTLPIVPGSWVTKEAVSIYSIEGSKMILQEVLNGVNNVYVADFNADGLSDLIYGSGANLAVRLSNGNGFQAPKTFNAGVSSVEGLIHNDYNFDGYPDLVVHNNAFNQLKVFYWDPSEESFTVSEVFTYYVTDKDLVMYMDVNGNSVSDLVFIRGAKNSGSTTSKSFVIYNDASSGAHNKITRFGNGFGNSTEISYKRLNEPGDHYRRMLAEDSDTTVCVPDRGTGQCEIKQTADGFYQEMYNPFGLTAGSEELKKPVYDLSSPMHVVVRVDSSAPLASNINAKVAVSYSYSEAKVQAGGRGFLGFKVVSTQDLQTGIVTRTEYKQQFPYTGMPELTIVSTQEGEVLSEASNEYEDQRPANAKYYQPQLVKSEERSYPTTTVATTVESDGLQVAASNPLVITTTEMSYDVYGNVLTTKTTTEGRYGAETVEGVDLLVQEKRTENTYGDASSPAIAIHGSGGLSYAQLGRLTHSSSSGSRNSESQVSKEVSFTYTSGGLLESETVEPNGDSSIKLVTTYGYDEFGNQTSVAAKGFDGYAQVERKSTAQFDTEGRFLIWQKNALGHVPEEIIERDEYGAPTQIKSLNGIITDIRYDALGREISRWDNTAQENESTTRYLTCSQVSPSCPSGANYAIEKRQQHGGTTIEYFDRVGRTIRRSSIDFNGRWTHVSTQYDRLGRAARVSAPYRESPTYWTTTEYDILGRPLKITTPLSGGSEGTSTITYDGATVTTQNLAGYTKRETKNSFGELIKVEDNVHLSNAGKFATIEYTYNSEGKMTHAIVTGDNGKTIDTEIIYDAFGRKFEMKDPDKGHWLYRYNAFGELIWQQDASGQVVENKYDTLGRLYARTDFKNAAKTQVEGHTRWYFDGVTDESAVTIANAQGQLSALVMTASASEEKCSNTTATYCSYPEYDSVGRPTFTSNYIDTDKNTSTPLEHVRSGVSYSVLTGRVDKRFDVLHQLVRDQGVAIQSGTQSFYNQHGYLERTEDLRSGEILYQTKTVNARGQVTEAFVGPYGRGMFYDEATGHIDKQIAWVGGLSNLTTPDAFTIQHISYEWDDIGNLQSRHNQSALRDSGSGSGNRNLQESFCYDALNRLVKTNIGTTSTASCGSLTAAQQDQRYDAVGNITYKKGVGTYTYGHATKVHAVTATSDGHSYFYDDNGNMTAGAGRTLDYSTFDKPISITKGTHTSAFAYGPDRARYVQVDSNTNTSLAAKNTITAYFGDVERVTHNDGKMEWRRAVPGGLITYTTGSDFEMEGDAARRVMLKDHLGSIDVIADGFGNVEQSMSFDPWGARRSEDVNLTVLSAAALVEYGSDITSRGYTGHEMLDELGLVHMNGRVYDARLGRFLQADPFIQAANDAQMYNRYSYLRNNPLNATDPSGYFLKKLWNKIRPFVGVIVGIVLAVACSWCVASWYGAAVAGAAAGAAGAAANGGTLRDVIRGGLIGGVSAAAFYGVGQGFSKANCPACQAGDGAGVFGTKLTGTAFAKKVLSHSLVGGVMSVLQGAKFGHGFVAAGVTQAFSGKIDGLDKYSKVSAQRAVAAAVLGGATSVITGGKFANGAITAAFSRIFNDEAHYEVAQKGSCPVDGCMTVVGNKDPVNGVYAVADGEVMRAGWQDPNNHKKGLGFRISIKDKDGYYQYGHIDPDSLAVSPGEKVVKGQLLGSYADPSNGRSSGPHVHIERRLWTNPRVTVDPGSVSPLYNGIDRTTSVFGIIDSAHTSPHQGTDYAY